MEKQTTGNSSGNEPEQQELPRQRGRRTGLYNPLIEHDACGVGFVARLDAVPEHRVIEDALMALGRMAHRGASGCGPHTADGAGLLLPLPHEFMRRVWREARPEIRERQWPARYGIGQFFLPRNDAERQQATRLVERVLAEHGLAAVAWRETPVRPEVLRAHALEVMPCFRQLLVTRKGAPDENDATDANFERLLYIAGRHMEKAVREQGVCSPGDFHIASFSGRSIVYKGMTPGADLAAFYADLADRDFTAHFAVFHERYSTNTLSRWHLAQPFHCLAHNGEINTLPGNQANMRMREPLLDSPLFGADIKHVLPVLDTTASDSAQLDNALELLLHAGRSLPHAAMMLVPEPFGRQFVMGEDKRAFYEYHAALMEPWDGPAALVFTDGNRQIGAMLDRNALRPCRYALTTDGMILLASEAGVLDLPEHRIERRGRLQPRRMLMVDFARRRVVTDAECKSRVIYARPYRHWIREKGVTLRDLPLPAGRAAVPADPERLLQEQRLFGFCREDVEDIIAPMARHAQEPIGSMGMDTPLAVLSRQPQLLFSYLKQRFAQVTNPPIDPLREELVMTLTGFAGRRGNLLEETPGHYSLLRLANPVLFADDVARLEASLHPQVITARIPMLFPVCGGNAHEAGNILEAALRTMCANAEAAMEKGATLILLSDAGADETQIPVPSLLATSALHHHLLREKKRHACGILVDTGEAREVMHLAQLIAFGAGGIHPRLAFASAAALAADGKTGENDTPLKAQLAYATALQKGLLKTFSRMGISTLRSFQGGQSFEAVGLGRELIDRYFTGLPSRVGGIGLREIAADALARHAAAYGSEKNAPAVAGKKAFAASGATALEDTGQYRRRKGGEKHLWSPAAIRALHKAARENDERQYKVYAGESDDQPPFPVTLRSLLRFKKTGQAVPLAEVEPESAILERFAGGAMSLGSISPEAHQAIAIACNRLGVRSNCGEGGESPERRIVLENGDNMRSRTRQIASGRFGVTASYLAHADEIQIKMAQGAKPGEGGQLPAQKVLAEIARVRHTTPGVTLISPPPHHDIYSIEDLAQLIYDLKRLHPAAGISVKLVSGSNVGMIAAGVAKAGADSILISGHDGGTGASPRTAIRHVGLPFELGLAETHAALLHNGLRGRVRLQADGQLRTGRDLVMAAMLGADEFAFGSSLLVALGCCMLRVCHMGTCPVGIAAQDAGLRARFSGRPEHVENFLRFLARDMRRHMAALGFRHVGDMIGRADLLEPRPLEELEKARAENDAGEAFGKTALSAENWLNKIAGLDFTPLLHHAPLQDTNAGQNAKKGRHPFAIRIQASESPAPCSGAEPENPPDPFADSSLEAAMLAAVMPGIRQGRPTRFTGRVGNTDRAVCARLSGIIARQSGEDGLPPGSVDVSLTGSAGQSAGAFLTRGITLSIQGEANDYVGKGLSGGIIAVAPVRKSPSAHAVFPAGEQAAIGNVALYGATSGELFAAGTAGERFAVRNSGALAVVEGVGDHACEYMTGGAVVVLGSTGYNFAAGMSGGFAYVFDRSEIFQTRCNMDSVDLESVWRAEDIRRLRALLSRHLRYTGSPLAASVLEKWDACLPLFLKVTPIEYRRALARMKHSENPRAESIAATEEVYHA